jgi:predicted  nucleic acid-binding Zn-ribbon protein
LGEGGERGEIEGKKGGYCCAIVLQFSGAQQRMLDAEKSHTDILHQLSHLEVSLQQEREKEREQREMKEHIEQQDGQLARLREQLQETLATHEEREQHWESELFRLSAELELSQQKLVQLEKDLVASEEEMDALKTKLVSAQRMEDLAKHEVRWEREGGMEGGEEGREREGGRGKG